MGEPGRVTPARRRGLADEVADRIREAIFDGTYEPGAQLREVELSGDMDVSRGPVREALRLLEREGLVHCAWHRGTTVTSLSADDVAELAGLRGALEDLAVREVIARASEEDLASLAKTAGLTERSGDAHETVRRDIAFHDAVFAASGHRRLTDAWDGIRCQVHLVLLSRISHGGEDHLGRIPHEHRELAAALRTRDTDTARSLFAAHRRRTADAISVSPEPG
ncbi:GntR family transcriptional regulator [Streptomyces sp. NPDC101225]|uniref:GntR family transcriptional regulator n=1 Tax=Streptomyces sp. NPDC101225 TaxID=3366135 RepID=UPI0037FB6B93